MTKQCELCDRPARMYCESDQASLCWECDGKVHGANFLVARHTRSLLCRSCQAPTPWRASGSRLAPTVSVCERCLGAGTESGHCEMEDEEAEGGGTGIGGGCRRIDAEVEDVGDLEVDDEDDDEEENDEDEDEDDEDEDEDDEDEDDEDGDNQVVPWSTEAEAEAATPPPMASCSSSDESSSGTMAICQGFLRRMRENANPSTSHWQDDLGLGCSPSQLGYLHPSPPTSAAAAHSGRMLEEHEAAAPSVGCPIRHRKREAQPAGAVHSANRLRCDRVPRGASASVDFFFPSSSSPPI